MTRYTNNKELATAYRKLLFTSRPTSTTEENKWNLYIETVRVCPLNIPEAFYKSGSLKKVKIPGIGERNKEKLEAILTGNGEKFAEQRMAGRPKAGFSEIDRAKAEVEAVDGRSPIIFKSTLRRYN